MGAQCAVHATGLSFGTDEVRFFQNSLLSSAHVSTSSSTHGTRHFTDDAYILYAGRSARRKSAPCAAQVAGLNIGKSEARFFRKKLTFKLFQNSLCPFAQTKASPLIITSHFLFILLYSRTSELTQEVYL